MVQFPSPLALNSELAAHIGLLYFFLGLGMWDAFLTFISFNMEFLIYRKANPRPPIILCFFAKSCALIAVVLRLIVCLAVQRNTLGQQNDCRSLALTADVR